MNYLHIPAKPGDALVNALACFPDLEWLQRDFDILYFLDFCAGIESLVLHNKLFSIGPVQSLTESSINPVTETLLKEGVLEVINIVTSDRLGYANHVLSRNRARQMMSFSPNWIPEEDAEIYTSIMANIATLAGDLGLEEIFEVPLVLSAHALPLYLSLPAVQDEQKAFRRLRWELAKKYTEYKQTLFDLRQAADDDIIRIPPIALEVFTKADNFDDVSNKVMELRDKYKKLRQRFGELDEILRSNSQSPKKKLEEKAKLTKAINKLFTTSELDEITVTTSFATGLNDSVKIPRLIKDGADPSDIDWNKLVAFLIKKAESTYWKFRLSPLHSTKKYYLSLSKKVTYDSIRHLFGHQLTKKDIATAEKYSHVIAGLLAKENSNI